MMKKWLLLIVLTTCFSGCASFEAGIRPIALSTTPDGATATADAGRLDCITPCFLKLQSDSDHGITFHKDGYQDASVALVSVGSGWLLRDATLRPVVLLEFIKPEAYSLSQDSIQVMLMPLPASGTSAEAPQLADIQKGQSQQTEVDQQQYVNQQIQQYVDHQNSAWRSKERKFPLLRLLSAIGIGSGRESGTGLPPGLGSSNSGGSPFLKGRARSADYLSNALARLRL